MDRPDVPTDRGRRTNGHDGSDVRTNGHDEAAVREAGPRRGRKRVVANARRVGRAARRYAVPLAGLALYGVLSAVGLFLAGVAVLFLATRLESSYAGVAAVFTVGGLAVAGAPVAARWVVEAALSGRGDRRA